MNILQYPENTNKNSSTQLHVWNNAAFDGEELQGFSFPINTSCSSLNSSSSDSTKENLSPTALNSPPKSSTLKPLCTTTANKKNKKKTKVLEPEDEKKKNIDDEIEEIEKEIKRLSSRLEALRLEKAERNASKTVEKRGRIIAAKFMEPKQSVNADTNAVKKIEETPKSKMRRGVSLGPAEIFGKFSTQSRRKSCFWKLEEVDEVKGMIERREILSVGPKLKSNLGRDCSIQGQKHAATVALGARKSVKREDGGVVALVQPRKLFKEVEKEKEKAVMSSKRPAKQGRVVASRYNQISTNGNGNSVGVDARKRSLPENDDGDGGKRCEKKRVSALWGSNNQGRSEVRVKKRWEIPAEFVVYKKGEVVEEVADMNGGLLPKIRTLRCHNESPRDSGAAKRVAELSGKRSYFCPDEGVQASICQVLSFAEEEEEEEEG